MEHHHHEHDENCGCRHEHEHHHHQHGEDCGCGHHHEHEHHHHDHGEDCGCGHHHEHHEHSDDCGCGHHHEHEHAPNTPYIIDGHTHEGASVGTGTLTVTGHYQELEDTVRNELKALADWTAEQGGIIGHIKSSLVSTHTAMLSITEDEVNTISSDTEEVRINMAAIVFAIPLEEVKARVEDICKKLVQMTDSK